MTRLTLLTGFGVFPSNFTLDSRLDLELVEAPRLTRQLSKVNSN